ncbi:MAG: hypothetical protein HY457_00495 [Parcubacteria group bacterium]|nr:hypothetical protein [Parcubacteria group bacterium]
MREKGEASRSTYESIAKRVATEGRGRATYLGEQRVSQGKGLDPLVDPRGLPKYGPVRGAGNLLIPDGDGFLLKYGVAMAVQTDIDTTGSMGNNIDIAFQVQPKVQNLLIQGDGAVLRRYNTQMCTGVIQDEVDRFPYQRSQFEPDNEVERQMGLFDPQRGGGDPAEEYQLGLFAAAYLTDASITRYGLRGYYFSVGDEIGRDQLDRDLLARVFGSDVLEKAFGSAAPQSLPTTREVAKKLLGNWHGFFLQVKTNGYVGKWWSEVLGKERVVQLPRTEDLAEVQACIIGLTEGVLNLQSAVDFLRKAGLSRGEATSIVDACAGIPVGLQTTFPNFEKIPLAGATFASREDIWPIGTKGVSSDAKSKRKKSAGAEKKKPDWKL